MGNMREELPDVHFFYMHTIQIGYILLWLIDDEKCQICKQGRIYVYAF